MRDDWERVRTDVYYIQFLQRRYHPICKLILKIKVRLASLSRFFDQLNYLCLSLTKSTPFLLAESLSHEKTEVFC